MSGTTGGERIASPSKVSAWLDCKHYLNLRHRVDDGTMEPPDNEFSAFAQLLVEKGLGHEAECLRWYEDSGFSVYRVPDRDADETFAQWVERIGNPMEDGHDVVFQMPFVHDGMRGVADFLVRTISEDGAIVSYEPVDSKLARHHASPGHVLQLCFYAEAVGALTGVVPEAGHLFLGSGELETIRFGEVDAYWRRLRRQLSVALSADPDEESRPEQCAHCDFCEFAGNCNAQWRSEDSLVFVANVRAVDRKDLEEAGVGTMADLATADQGSVSEMAETRFDIMVEQARLQVEARENPDELPPFVVLDPEEPDPAGLVSLPQPNRGDIFLDFEGHPFWTPARGLFFLFGFLRKARSGRWGYEARWAHDPATEATATRELIDYLHERHRRHPGMHVYHYNHTERSALEELVEEHGLSDRKLADLIGGGVFVDLYETVRHSIRAGVESYGLKNIEKLAGFTRSAGIERGAGAVLEYEAWMGDEDPDRLSRIAVYNEDDVAATRAVRDWLVGLRPDGLGWPGGRVESEEVCDDEFDVGQAQLLEFPEESPERLLGNLLDYWRREYRVHAARLIADLQATAPDALESLAAIAGLAGGTLVPPSGNQRTPRMRFTFPRQEIGPKLIPVEGGRKPTVSFLGQDGLPVMVNIDSMDFAGRSLELAWGTGAAGAGTVPSVVVLDDWVMTKPKFKALATVAEAALGAGASGVAGALLARDLPRFLPGAGPADDVLGRSLEEICDQVAHLDRSFLAIQGPPGTGKTWTGARIVHHLVMAGMRVGITAFSHKAIDNLLDETVSVFREAGDLSRLSAVRKGDKPSDGGPASVTYASGNPQCGKGEFNLVAGTTWLFSSQVMIDGPVDVLVIDEAGQLGLADAMAAATSATNVVLLGDPQQLPQVAQASHPAGSGVSVLEQVLGGDATVGSDRGVFLAETRRMHPDICTFISDNFYDGRLRSHPGCAVQETDHGTGLRWIRSVHTDRSTESPEEAAIVVETIADLLGSNWTDSDGVVRPFDVSDFIVVAPYNDQVNLIDRRLAANRRTRGVRVGTVDRFQGQEAPVVLFSMATSDASLVSRGSDFLFSRNRLNVALSRARCLAFLICTNDLLASRARNVDDMKLISTLCAFAEEAERQQGSDTTA